MAERIYFMYFFVWMDLLIFTMMKDKFYSFKA
jgi:hypothetical protein